MKLTLQKLLWPTIGVCTQEALYFRLEKAFPNGDTIELQHGGTAAFSTYFNCFSMDKWREYTVVQSLALRLELKGHFRVRLLSEHLINDGITTDCAAGSGMQPERKGGCGAALPCRCKRPFVLFSAGTGARHLLWRLLCDRSAGGTVSEYQDRH